MGGLDVTVIVPVFDAMPHLVTCLSSLMEQSIGAGRIEVIAVDDGSGDGSAAQLDLLAAHWPGLRVVHGGHSGGPSRPRNTGLDLAAGRFVFFLDADDYLAAQALERMVTLADDRTCDVVACRRAAVGGPKGITGTGDHIPLTHRPRHTGVTPDVYDSVARRTAAAQSWTSLLMAHSDCKQLFRRERIERLGLRFAEGVHFGEDNDFAAAFAAGASVAMVDDYDCYYERADRPDGTSLTSRLIGTQAHLAALERRMAREENAGLRWRHDHQVIDAVLDVTQQVFNQRFLRRDDLDQQHLVERARGLLATWLTPRAAARLPALDRVKANLIGRGMTAELRVAAAGTRSKDVVRDGRVYGGYPLFGDAAAGVPEQCYDVTGELTVQHHLSALSWQGPRLRLAGHAYIEHVDTTEVATELVLRPRLGRGELRWPVRPVAAALPREPGGYDYTMAGFEAEADLAGVGGPMPPGTWGVFLTVRAQGVAKEVPLGGSRAACVDAAVRAADAAAGVVASLTTYGTLTLTVPRAS